jgi:N-succinyldiaminopimelate aminotransferase
MPRPPRFCPDVEAVPGAIYTPFADEATSGGRVFPLHVGDTWLEPLEGARMQDLRQADHPAIGRYTPTRGIPPLLEAIVEKVRTRNRLPCEPTTVLVTGGATAGLAAAAGALAAPGEEVLILAPFWPLIRGIVRSFRARPVEVPFYDRVETAEAAVEAVRERLTPASVAFYVSTPSNPTGRVLPESWLVALADLARREGLWIISDEVYEDIVYGVEHHSIARFAPERTVTAFSFSKSYAMAGNRVGYLHGPEEAVAQIHKVSTHTVYCAPHASQLSALHALLHGDSWLEAARGHYREAGADAARVLGLPKPQGSTFLFVDVRDRIDERGLRPLLEECLEDGVIVAPGGSSGDDYASWIRLCYTVCPPPDTAEAVRRIAKRIGAGP